MNEIELRALVSDLAGAFSHATEGDTLFPIFEVLLPRLADGQSVPIEAIARALGMDEPETAGLLRRAGAEIDQDGRLVGLGLTLWETPHRFEVGGRTLFTWCALDTLMFPAILGRARVDSPCHATGRRVTVEVSPDGVERVDPPEAVVSIGTPRPGEPIRSSFCDLVHFFSSRSVADGWLEQHSGAVVISVADAFRLGAALQAARRTAAAAASIKLEPGATS